MKKKIILLSLTAMLATGVSAYAETTEEIEYDGNGWPMVRYIKTPIPEIKNPIEIQTPEEEGKDWERIPPLTEAPEVGTTLANIVKEGDNLDLRNASSYTAPYATHSIGQCTWYARGRFQEIYGIEFPYLENAKEWVDNAYQSNKIKTVLDINAIPEQAVAVFAPKGENDTHPGHVVFIEYVERNADGNPQNVFYTEANGANDLNKGQYDSGYDGVVQKETFSEFKNKTKLKLLGYIVPNE